MAETFRKGEMNMNKLIKKIACAVMAFTLITAVFTGCKANKSASATASLPSYTSVKDSSGNLPEKGTVGDIEYRIMKSEEFGCYNKDRGYYIDQLEQLDSPYFIVISGGTHLAKDSKITITDIGMQDSTLVIVVEEKKGSGEKFEDLNCPCAELEVDRMPAEILIVNTNGEQFDHLKF